MFSEIAVILSPNSLPRIFAWQIQENTSAPAYSSISSVNASATRLCDELSSSDRSNLRHHLHSMFYFRWSYAGISSSPGRIRTAVIGSLRDTPDERGLTPCRSKGPYDWPLHHGTETYCPKLGPNFNASRRVSRQQSRGLPAARRRRLLGRSSPGTAARGR